MRTYQIGACRTIVRDLKLIGLSAVVLCSLQWRANAASITEEWVQRYPTTTNEFTDLRSIAVDQNGDVVVAGNAEFYLVSFLVALKYSGTGACLWTNRFADPASDIYGNAVCSGSNNNVFVTGSATKLGGFSPQYLTLAYSAGGIPLWTNYGPTGAGVALRVDNSGNIYVTGSGFTTIAYSDAGVALWTNGYGVANYYGSAQAMALSSNRVYVTGYLMPYTGENGFYVTIAYTSAGVPLWTNRYNGPGNGEDIATAIAAGINGNVYVTGYSKGSGTGLDYATIAYSSNGGVLWSRRYNNPQWYDDYASAIAVDGGGRVYVTGWSVTFDGDQYLTIAYSSSGAPLWTNSYYRHWGDDHARAIAVGPSGNVYVTGNSAGYSTGWDFGTVAYSSAGTLLWNDYYNGPGNRSDAATAIAVDAGDNVYVAGNSGVEFVTIKYSQIKPEPLGFQLMADQLILSWTNSAFNLQTAVGIQSAFTNVPNARSPHTNATTGAQQYFRLITN